MISATAYTVPSALPDSLLTTLAEQFGGYSVTDHRGGWVGPDGRLWEEPSQSVTCFLVGPGLVDLFTDLIVASAAIVGEESVLVTEVELQATFVPVPVRV